MIADYSIINILFDKVQLYSVVNQQWYRSYGKKVSQQNLSTEDAANILGVSHTFLIKLVEEDTIPYYKVGNHKKINTNDLRTNKNTIRNAREE